MNEVFEEVVIRVHNKELIECLGLDLDAPVEDWNAWDIRKCGIMAQAIGWTLGNRFDEEKAPKLLAHMTHLALIKMSEELEKKNGEGN